MAEVSYEQQFRGTVALAILHLRRLAKSNDTDKGFAAARDLRMIDDEQEAFMRECIALDEQMKTDSAEPVPVDAGLIKRLQACILSINSADPA